VRSTDTGDILQTLYYNTHGAQTSRLVRKGKTTANSRLIWANWNFVIHLPEIDSARGTSTRKVSSITGACQWSYWLNRVALECNLILPEKSPSSS